jgi:hypothetical protein
MNAVSCRSRMAVAGLIGRLVFDVAWIAHQQFCFWSSVAAEGSEIRHRRKTRIYGGLCVIEHFRGLSIASVAPWERL